jgi:hypothetical protein
MADDMDMAADLAAAHTDRSIAVARDAAAAQSPVYRGDCEACCDEDVWVRVAGGMPRCTPCRERWERRR